jgi:homocysteine S-methyltransferase
MSKFLDLLQSSPKPILSDGAMGTVLNMHGIEFEHCFDCLNLDQPAVVADIHREYIEAGSQIIQTNTFGANRYKLARHGMADKVCEINRAGVDLARRVIMASFRDVLIAGDLGPLGVRLAPFGRVQPEEAREAFIEQIDSLISAGSDLIIIETMTDLYEIREAILAARQVNPQIPVIASMTFTRDDRTLLGDDPGKVARQIHETGADVIGVNCSGGPNQILRILKKMRQVVPEGHFSVMPNAGWPVQNGGRIMYPAGPEYFGEYALTFWLAGANVIGGCCGTTPRHIRAMSQAIQSTSLEKITNGISMTLTEAEENTSEQQNPTQLQAKLSAGNFVVAVEVDPPKGVSTYKLLAGASLLADAGADVINVADSPMARMRMSPWAACNIIQNQAKIETVVHFPTRGRSLLRLQGDLLAAHALGVRNVFVVMGDPTAIGDYPDAMDNYDMVPSGLIKLIKQGFNAGVDHAGAQIGQPTSFYVGCALNLDPPDLHQEVKTLRRKIRAGADFILTQPIYQPERIPTFLKAYEKENGPIGIPILIGILPLANSRHSAFLKHEVPGITIPDEIHARLEQAGENGSQIGIQIAVELIQQSREYANGVYLMPPFNRYDTAAAIIEAVR